MAGDIGWADSPRGKQDMPADDLAKAREELRTDMVGIMREPGAFTFQALEPKDVDGKACLPVYVTGVGEDYRIIYFSAETGLPLLVEQPGTSPMSGAPVTQKAYIDEYATFGGFTMPKAMRLVFDDEEFAKGRIDLAYDEWTTPTRVSDPVNVVLDFTRNKHHASLVIDLRWQPPAD